MVIRQDCAHGAEDLKRVIGLSVSKPVRAAQKKQCVYRLREYVWMRRETLDDPTALANGWEIGSGPTEATRKTLAFRRHSAKWACHTSEPRRQQ